MATTLLARRPPIPIYGLGCSIVIGHTTELLIGCHKTASLIKSPPREARGTYVRARHVTYLWREG